MNIWDTCKHCGACCHNQHWELVELTMKEKQFFNKDHFECQNGRCTELTEDGCRHDSTTRPLVCRMYPFVLVKDDQISIDMVCPIAPDLLRDLVASPRSETSEMLLNIRKEIKQLRAIGDPTPDQMIYDWTEGNQESCRITLTGD